MSEPLSEPAAAALAKSLHEALARDLGSERFASSAGATLSPPENWNLVDQYVAMLKLRRQGTEVVFFVYPTRADQPAYRRTARLDVCYSCSDSEPDAQQKFFEANRDLIDGFCAWLATAQPPA